ncbi:hypothetical protein CDG81_13805 [Actinopolyspora erythraea]|uniref:Peptidase inhibitor family I36 n=1 Tax=Actinopolyspora erythraea TaxID=414996 RepID=A0A223RTM0_9ACTN|nr:peptidase inhibitor family I36 protein [Actinopolyspora erythraea]ASU79187.1 hypothetical protein CDG81_13805 [Actinopolyspora erythraea]
MRKRRLGALVAAVVAVLSVGFPATASASPVKAAAESCPAGYLCVYDLTSFVGDVHRVYECGYIHNIGLDWGSDQVASYINNQTGNALATFYNWNGSEWVPIGYSTAPEAVPYAPSEFYDKPDGVDGIKLC